MAKREVSEVELPTADDAGEVAAEVKPEGDTSLPLFNVEAKGLQSLSFHAIDESEAVRLFYKKHGVPSHEFNHRVTRVS